MTPKTNPWTGFAVLTLPLLLVSMDVSVLYFAIPEISQELRTTATEQLWIFDIYGFVLAGLLLTMGSLGDRIGRRKLLLFGAAAFGAASVLAAYAPSAEALIAARALLGVGGATLMPSTLGIVRTLFTDAAQRAKAIGIWSGAMAGGVALGSVMSGFLLEHFWWGSVFLVNVPAMLLLLLVGPFLIPESRDPNPPARFDLLSVPLSMATVLPAVYGLKEISAEGFAARYLLFVAAGLVFGALFVRRQRTVPYAMLSRSLFTHRLYAVGVTLNTLVMFAMMGSAFFTTQYLQSVLGYDPLKAALWSLAPSLLIGGVAPLAATTAQRVEKRYVAASGFLIAAAGFAAMAVAGTDSLALVLGGAALIGSGVVTVSSIVTDLALGTAPADKASTAGSLLETGQEFGGALGMAVLGSVGTAAFTAGLPAGAPETLGEAVAVPGLVDAARAAFVDGMAWASYTGIAVLLVGALLAVRLLRTRPDETAPTVGAPAAEPVG
ncbi:MULTISPECIES: MFS transporter [unclassified Streptomyces]|uniref:MFS transporter n=1 Tax=unclassified Streptomyces TaxID=2593676 RepID=UPI00278BB631|nr:MULTISPECIES: MFS transporter [unclassified Streptomyces]